MIDKIERLLVIAAHPDDETLGCGGLIARTIREGGNANVLIITEGSSTQYPDRPDLIGKKQAEARKALHELGGAHVEFAGLPDMALAAVAPAEVNSPIEDAVRRHRPDCVAVHHRGDLNRDHQLLHQAARVAARPVEGSPPLLIAFETLSSTEWGEISFSPNLYVELSEEDLEKKVTAFAAYETEVRRWPHPRSATAIRHLAGRRGTESGYERAEAFEVVWARW
jgi:LmbE family N-acetylglucosaminyl deacetylase